MVYNKDKHWKFLEQELKSQTAAFKQKLVTPALFLLREKEELYIAQLLKVGDGEMILSFPNTRAIPRNGEYLYCFIVPKELRNYRKWGDKTYGELIKAKTNFSEVVCIWQNPSVDKDFSLVGFRGVDIEFAEAINNAKDIILILGPNKPPFEYLANLQTIVSKTNNVSANRVLNIDYSNEEIQPFLIHSKKNTVGFILSQLCLQDSVIIQGPPGTGKTHLIAEICEKICNEGKTVLVTALTNRALIEIADKPSMEKMLKEERVFKTKLSIEEANLLPNLQVCKKIEPQKGCVILSTFFITSSIATEISNEPIFDFVIVDEASQSLLGMFVAAKILGQKNILIGDTKQLPPVTSVSEDMLTRNQYWHFVDGLKTLSNANILPYFQLAETYRLSQRAATYTSIFYSHQLNSNAKKIRELNIELPTDIGRVFNPQGGPTLIKTTLPVGELKPPNALLIANELVTYLLKCTPSIDIAVLTYFVETTKALQKTIFKNNGYRKNLLIETVSRVQGLTTDVCIFIVPNSSCYRSLENRLFNVATSRSKLNTIIITDTNILNNIKADKLVLDFLRLLDSDFSFIINPEKVTSQLEDKPFIK